MNNVVVTERQMQAVESYKEVNGSGHEELQFVLKVLFENLPERDSSENYFYGEFGIFHQMTLDQIVWAWLGIAHVEDPSPRIAELEEEVREYKEQLDTLRMFVEEKEKYGSVKLFSVSQYPMEAVTDFIEAQERRIKSLEKEVLEVLQEVQRLEREAQGIK